MMGKHKWTSGEEKLLVDSILAGQSRADICDKLGLSDSVVHNHYRAMRATDKTLPMFPRAEKTAAVSEDQAEPQETKEKKVELNPLEKEMADIITENNETMDSLRIELETEKAARELEAKAYQAEIDRLKAQIAKLKEMVRMHSDGAMVTVGYDLEAQLRERDLVIYAMAKALFLRETEGQRA